MAFLRPIRFLAFLLLWCGPAIGQQPTREAQIPLDPERGVLEIGAALRSQLGLFPDQEGFQTARLFRQDDGSLVLEVSRIEQGTLVRERRRWTDAELATFRSDLAGRFAAQGQTGAVDREGRSGLVLTETLLGLGLYGWAVPVGFHIDSPRGAVAAYLLTAGLSFYLPYRITRNASVSVAERNAAVWGATRGIVHGALVGNLLNGPDDPSESTTALSVLGMSLAESVLGYQIAQGLGASEGEVAFWSAGGDFGIPFGFGLAYLAGLFDENVQRCEFDLCVVDEYVGTRAGYGTTLAMAMASPWLVRLSGQGRYYTVGDARALRSMGVLGAQVVLPLAWAAFRQGGRSSDKPLVAAVLAGSAAGMWLGNNALRERSLSGGDGFLVLAGALGRRPRSAGSDLPPGRGRAGGRLRLSHDFGPRLRRRGPPHPAGGVRRLIGPSGIERPRHWDRVHPSRRGHAAARQARVQRLRGSAVSHHPLLSLEQEWER